jgi:hypothetical protein
MEPMSRRYHATEMVRVVFPSLPDEAIMRPSMVTNAFCDGVRTKSTPSTETVALLP